MIFGWDFLVGGKVFLPLDFVPHFRPWSTLPLPRSPLNNQVISDVAEAGYPFLHFFSSQLKAGDIPFWNPNIFIGLPTAMMSLTNFNFNPLYLLLFRLLSPATAHGAAMLIDLTIIGTFSYLFFRRRGLSDPGALFGALTLMFNGVLMVWLEFMSGDFSYAGMAVSLYCFERSLAERRIRFLLLNGVAIGVLLLAGSIQWVFFLIPLLGLYAGMRTYELYGRDRTMWENLTPLRAYTTALVLGVLLALPTLLHFLEYMPLSQRTEVDFETIRARTGTFHPEMLITLLFPNFFGYQPTGPYFAPGSGRSVYQNYNEMTLYMGLTTVWLAFMAYRVRANRRIVTMNLALIALGLIVAMKLPGLYYLLWKYVPGFNGMQPSRIFAVLPFAFATLAAYGLDGLLRHPPNRREAAGYGVVVAGTAVLAIAAVAALHWYFTSHPTTLHGAVLAKHFRVGNSDFLYPILLMGGGGVALLLFANGTLTTRSLSFTLLALLLVDLIPFGLRLNTRSDRSLLFPPTTGLRYLTQDNESFRILPIGFRYNVFMAADVATVGGYASMFPASYLELLAPMELAETGTRVGERLSSYIEPIGFMAPLLPLLNVKYLVAPNDAALPDGAGSRYQLVHRSDLAVFRANRYLPRAFFVSGYERLPTRADVIARMLRPDFDPSRLAIGERDLPHVDSAGAQTSVGSPTIRLSRPSSDRLNVNVETPGPGVLVVSEQFFPGWEAFVNGERTEIIPVNAVLMGIALPAGAHEVVMRYFPPGIARGAPLALVTALLMMAAAIVDIRKNRPAKPPSTP